MNPAPRKRLCLGLISGLLLAALVAPARADNPWPMAGANPARTSWSPEEVKGSLAPLWYRAVEPYISQNVQLIAAQQKVFVATARGLYALHAATGDTAWVYPTALPLGHSPTYHDGALYVGGFDRRLHCLDAATGQRHWTFDEAKAGYRTSPLVAGGLVLLGNRDGWFYAVHAHGTPQQGVVAWKVQTGGPILTSAAFKDGVVYFASQDSHAYALNVADGSLRWKSAKLHGAGFHSWWPVLWRDLVVLVTQPNYRSQQTPGVASCQVKRPQDGSLDQELINGVERDEIYNPPPADKAPIGAEGQVAGDWVAGTKTYDASKVTQYFEAKPWRQSHLFLRQADGAAYSFDADGDGKPEFPPILTTGTKNGNHAPPIVGYDNVLYQQNNYRYGGWICGGQIAGWKIDSPFISQITGDWGAVDEPHIASAGGKLIYWTICCDRESGIIDISQPYGGSGREWGVFQGYNLYQQCPGYDEMWTGVGPNQGDRLYGMYGSLNGIYHNHTNDQNPFVPYEQTLFIHRSNGVLAFKAGGANQKQPLALTQAPPAGDAPPALGQDELRQLLEAEVLRWVAAGHLHTGYFNGGQFGQQGALNNYFATPGENLWALVRALPHLSSSAQQAVTDFIKQELAAYPPSSIADLGFKDGASRDWFLYPPEVDADRANFPATTHWTNTVPDLNIYALWKVAEKLGDAAAVLESVKGKLRAPPDQAGWAKAPYELNAAIAGHWGYLGLEKLAGQSETASARAALDQMLAWRAANFAKDSPFPPGDHHNRLNLSRNFISLTPELGEHLGKTALAAVTAAVAEYERVAPYWFVTRYEGCWNESTIQNLHDAFALFHAKAWILRQSREELVQFLDVPAFQRGDVYYLHRLVSAIEAPALQEVVATPVLAPPGGQFAGPVAVTVTCATAGANITTTLDGSEPTAASTPVEAGTPLTFSRTTTLRARAFKAGMAPSNTVTAVFTVGDGPPPGDGRGDGSVQAAGDGGPGGHQLGGGCGCALGGPGLPALAAGLAALLLCLLSGSHRRRPRR